MSECECRSCGNDRGQGSGASAVRVDLVLIAVSAAAVAAEFLRPGMLPVSLAWVGVVLCGLGIMADGLRALLRLDIRADVLVTVAMVASIAVGEVMAAAEVAVIMRLGEMLETWTVARARAGIQRLVDLTPETARRLSDDGTESEIGVGEVRIGDVLRVLPGERIPVDGVIEDGNTSADSSVISGESVPVDLAPGDRVMSGMVNLDGSFVMRAEKTQEDSSVQRMVGLVREADAGRSEIVSLADRWSVWIVALAAVSALGTFLFTGDVLRAVTVLVVFCPCGMVLATPTAVTAAIGNLTHRGILVREGDALERLSQVSHVLMDKTGTMTRGVLSVRDVVPAGDMDADDLLALAVSVEGGSEHPIGRAVVAYGREHGVVPSGTGHRAVPGFGMTADVSGTEAVAGSLRMLRARGVEVPEGADSYGSEEGRVVVHLAADGVYAGHIELSDILRDETAGAVEDIERLGYVPVMLTGDRRETAESAAASVGIDRVMAECTPEDKMDAVAELEDSGSHVCMIGDGVNDAPALRRAYVGISMGGIGSDIAVEASDIVLTEDGFGGIAHMLALSKRMMSAIRVSISLSLCFNIGGILFAVAGLLDPFTGALVHSAGAFVAIANAAALLGWHQSGTDDYQHVRPVADVCSCCTRGQERDPPEDPVSCETDVLTCPDR